jgi:hypothetical protein
MSENITTISRTGLEGLRELLTTQRTRRVDLIAPAARISYDGGMLRVDTDQVVMSGDGVTSAGGWYAPTGVFDEGAGETLGVPRQFMRKLREEGRTELLDQTVNHFLHGSSDGTVPGDPRSFMTRLFRGDDTGGGVARAFLSDRYKPIDHLDVLVSALNGIRDAGAAVEIGRCDITEQRMYVQVRSPEVAALAPELLKGYRSPYTGAAADDNPVVFAGFVISNSETGRGAATLTPRLTVQVCGNGMTLTRDAMRAVHLGTRHEEGIVRYSADTLEKELALVTAKTRDAVATFLDADYVTRQLRAMEEQAGAKVTRPEETVKQAVRAAGVPLALEEDVFAAFIKGGQLTAGGIMQAVTAVARDLGADAAYDLEGRAAGVLAAAARLA